MTLFAATIIVVVGLVLEELWWIALFGIIPAIIYLADIFVRYWYTHMIITENRIIVHERRGFFNIYTGELRIENLKESKIERLNFLEVICGFGDISIHGFDAEEVIYFHGVPHPRKVRNYIAKIMQLFHENGALGIKYAYDDQYEKRKNKERKGKRIKIKIQEDSQESYLDKKAQKESRDDKIDGKTEQSPPERQQ